MDLRDPAILESISNSITRPSVSRPVKKLYRGEPMALGITQIIIGILEIAFGLVVAIAQHGFIFYYELAHAIVPYWMGILYVISGSLSVVAAKNLKIPLVKAMLGMNVVSAVAAGIAIVMFSTTIAHPGYSRCNGYYIWNLTSDICYEFITIPEMQLFYISAILLTFTILEFFITITTAAFGCASVCRDVYSETTVVIFQNTAQEAPPAVLTPVKEDEAP